MKRNSWLSYLVSAFAVLLAGCAATTPPQSGGPDLKTARITVLYDAFGRASAMKKDWGYAALVEVGGRRILFDTGGNAEIFAQNVKAKGVDLTTLDFVVMSHRHGDHMGGLAHLLNVNPKVKVYAPRDGFGGVYGSSLPSSFYRKAESSPREMRYYDGAPPAEVILGSAWPAANFDVIDKTTEVAPGVWLIALTSDAPGTRELKELSLAIDTPDGIVLVVACSHPGIEAIVEAASKINKHIHFVAGGFHLVVAPDPAIAKIATSLKDNWKVDWIAPGHCTGEPTFVALKQTFGDRYLYAGLGTTLVLGAAVRSAAEAGHPQTQAMEEDDLESYRELLARGADAELQLLAGAAP